jgi:hypothetical protein
MVGTITRDEFFDELVVTCDAISVGRVGREDLITHIEDAADLFDLFAEENSLNNQEIRMLIKKVTAYVFASLFAPCLSIDEDRNWDAFEAALLDLRWQESGRFSTKDLYFPDNP